MHVPKGKISKLDKKDKECIFIAYKDGVKIYKLWNPVTRKLVYSQNVIFKEVGETSMNEDESRGEDP